MYKSFFDNNHDATYTILPNGEFTLFNKSTCILTGYSEAELLGMPFKNIIDPNELAETKRSFESALSGRMVEFTSIIVQKSGKKRNISGLLFPVYIKDEIQGVIGVSRDVTDKTISEKFRSGQNKILEMIAKNKSYQHVLDEISLLFEIISTGRCSIMMLEDDVLSVISAPSMPNDFIESIDDICVLDLENFNRVSVLTKQMILTKNIDLEPLWNDYRIIAKKANIQSCCSIPLFDEEENVLGTFVVYFNEVYVLNEKEIEIFKEIANLASVAIQHYRSKEKNNFLALHDALTGLPNRRMFNQKIYELLHLSENHHQNFSVLFIDLDRFKLINDMYGHNMGDLFLIEVSKRLKKCLRDDDIIARQGGDEFIILVSHSSVSTVENIATRLLANLEEAFSINHIEISITPSIGISTYPHDGGNIDDLVKNADEAMYHAKKDGGNMFKFHDNSMKNLSSDRLKITNHIQKALRENEFSLYYQPKVELFTNKIKSVEALIRWKSPELGDISPQKFIPIAEETGLIISIGEWVAKEACLQLKRWEDTALKDLSVSINLSMRQFFKPNLVHTLKRIINETKINPSLLELEITESMTMDVQVAKSIVNELKEIGVRISIDDFGTGYSSFNYLKHFPLDYVKMDQSFMQDITENQQSKDVVKIMLMMAKALKVKVVAEGVETKEQLDILIQLECDEVQGFYFSKPLPIHDFEVYFENFVSTP